MRRPAQGARGPLAGRRSRLPAVASRGGAAAHRAAARLPSHRPCPAPPAAAGTSSTCGTWAGSAACGRTGETTLRPRVRLLCPLLRPCCRHAAAPALAMLPCLLLLLQTLADAPAVAAQRSPPPCRCPRCARRRPGVGGGCHRPAAPDRLRRGGPRRGSVGEADDAGGRCSERQPWSCSPGWSGRCRPLATSPLASPPPPPGCLPQELGLLLQEERLAGATLLILANKQDVPGALGADAIREARACVTRGRLGRGSTRPQLARGRLQQALPAWLRASPTGMGAGTRALCLRHRSPLLRAGAALGRARQPALVHRGLLRRRRPRPARGLWLAGQRHCRPHLPAGVSRRFTG